MKRFYFDLFDGTDVSRDEEGTTFDDLKQAKNAAAISLLEIMTSRKIEGDASELMFLVRDASDIAAFAIRLSLQVSSDNAFFGTASVMPSAPSVGP